ncbi:hypothetical protein [Burkholderia gladioli]|uniref:hypothetical protein n=1 Tax=Burkholderia gladioli TaxID=28095 RepID=UPI00163E367E|nr:hypothetical protein [Burkholderia gladioli]
MLVILKLVDFYLIDVCGESSEFKKLTLRGILRKIIFEFICPVASMAALYVVIYVVFTRAGVYEDLKITSYSSAVSAVMAVFLFWVLKFLIKNGVCKK